MGGGKGDECYVTGYRYYAGLHLVFCHALDKLIKIKVGDKWAWEGAVTANQTIAVSKPNLFGGDGREGGIKGNVDVCFGLPDQPQNSYLQKKLGNDIPAFRGLFGLIARRCLLAANNPYIKEWAILGQRSRVGWRDDLADIVASDGYVDMNPAHIIYEALTNTSWGGLGYPVADLDTASFESAAYFLASGTDPRQEGFGLSLLWARDSSIEDFLNIILDHIDGVLYFSHRTGLLTLKLIRNDYTKALLPVIDQRSAVELVEYYVASAAEAVNQVTVKWVDRANQAQATTVQDIAGITRAGGQIIQATVEMPGIATEEWAHKIAARELQQMAMPLASCTLTVNRKHWSLEPGDCFVFDWPPIGLSGVVMRVNQVEIGEYTDSTLRIKAARDVYGLGPVAITTPAESLWTNPLTAPADAVRRKIQEITWWQFVRLFGESAAVLAELEDDSTMLTCCCDRPSSDALNYEMWTRNVGAAEFVKRDTDSFPFVSATAMPLSPEISSVIQLQDADIDTDLVKVGTYAALGDELVAITAMDEINGTLTVNRGVLDTIPVAHAAGTLLWCHQSFFGLDRTDRAVGEQVEIKLLPSTAEGRLQLADASTDTHTCVGRMMRPYPPGNVQVNGQRWPDKINIQDGITITWAHRDRTQQTVTLVRQDEGNIGPEAGVTYAVRVYDAVTGAMLKEQTGITGTSDTTDLIALGHTDVETVRIELESIRASLVSQQRWSLTVAIDADQNAVALDGEYIALDGDRVYLF